MNSLLLLGLLFGIPLLLLTVLRIKPLYAFVSIMTGYVWAQYLGDPAELILRSGFRVPSPDLAARIGLLLIPVVITLLLMRKSLSASALPFQFFLLVANSLLLTVLIADSLPTDVQRQLYQSNAGNVVRQSGDVVIAGVAGLHVLVMWIMRPKHHDTHGHGKKKRH